MVDELLTEDFVEHNPPPGIPPDREGCKQTFTMYRTAFPDMHLTVEDRIAAGDKVVERWTSTGTHQGDFMGIAPTGRQITVEGMDISRLEGGKLVEHWTQFDAVGMMQQLGVIPEAAPAG